MQRFVLITSLSILINACTNPQDASEENFTQAIQAYGDHLTEQGTYCIEKGPYPKTKSIYLNLLDVNYSALLEKVGLLNKSGPSKGKGPKSINYDLTEKGKKYFLEGKGFCLGKPKVVRIKNFTAPQSMRGQTVSKVFYEYQYTDIPEWVYEISEMTVSNNKAYTEIRDIAASVSEPINHEALLVLMNDGWRHQKLLGKK
ncbi:MAG: hypothetical protein QNJ78_12165 [Gammaproteobacteria bacterium]|nr:hypothetical protein [Gammaproteobacteria bacterium]